MRWKASSTPSSGMVSRDEAVEVEAALAGRGRSASGSRGSAGSRRTSSASGRRPGRRTRSWEVGDGHRGRRHADLHDRAGQVAGEEAWRRTSGWPTASMHDVGAEPVGDRLDGLDGVGPWRRRRCGWRRSRFAHSSFRGSRSTATIVRAPASRAPRWRRRRRRRTRTRRRCRPAGRCRCSMAAPRPAITPQPMSPAASGVARGSTRHALAGGDERLLGEGADTEGRRQRRCRRASSSARRCASRSRTTAGPAGRSGTCRTAPARR